MSASSARPPGVLYARTTEFLRLIQANPDDATVVQSLIVGLTAHLTGVVDYPSWEIFKQELAPNLPPLSARVQEWADKAFAEGDILAGWAYELVSIDLGACGTPDPVAVTTGGLTSAIIRKALSDANPFDHSEPEPA